MLPTGKFLKQRFDPGMWKGFFGLLCFGLVGWFVLVFFVDGFLALKRENNKVQPCFR